MRVTTSSHMSPIPYITNVEIWLVVLGMKAALLVTRSTLHSQIYLQAIQTHFLRILKAC